MVSVEGFQPLKGGLVVVVTMLFVVTREPAWDSKPVLEVVVAVVVVLLPRPREPLILSRKPAFLVVVLVILLVVVVVGRRVVVVVFFPPKPREPLILSRTPAFLVVVTALLLVVVVVGLRVVVVVFLPPKPRDPLILSRTPAFLVVALVPVTGLLVVRLGDWLPVAFLAHSFSCLQVTPSCTEASHNWHNWLIITGKSQLIFSSTDHTCSPLAGQLEVLAVVVEGGTAQVLSRNEHLVHLKVVFAWKQEEKYIPLLRKDP